VFGPTGIIALILAVILLIAGGSIGYEFGRGVGYMQGKRAGAAAEASDLNAQGTVLARDAEAARQPALVAGALARLRAEWCVDCR